MNINVQQAVTAGILGLIPAIVAYMLITIAAGAETLGISILLIALLGFGYYFYQKTSIKGQASSMFFVLAIELLLSPLVFLIYTFVFTAENTAGDAEAAGAAIGGILLIGVAFFIGLPLAGVFYLISRKLDTGPE